MSSSEKVPFLAALISGGIAGTSVDVALYPLDTIKTRLQSPMGFLKAGGFSGIYKGLSAVAAGSAPGAALFFSTYEMAKNKLHQNFGGSLPDPVIHMTAASCGEVMACLVRVPTEVVKQRMQTGMQSKAMKTISHILANEGGVLGFYKGFGITVFREIPFAFIQFPLYELAKVTTTSLSCRSTNTMLNNFHPVNV
jgi:solute carrier family 25 (mitochondrial S-adenosylmethionine transporter), member 26